MLRIPWPWRAAVPLAVLALCGVPPPLGRTVTDLGHFLAPLLGTACCPLVRGGAKRRNPKETGPAGRG
ncbi:rhomboid-like protein [Streptomyces sp. NPDC006458]|uniref:rhomboid-like protein n=1 Tax=Streptomyces sp. NPDC006458 TaxID=3154302 RepID=UPI0033A2EF2A